MIQRRGLKTHETLYFFLFISPALIGFMLFYLGPMLASLVFSLSEYQIVRPPKFIGLENYQVMLFEDPLIWKSLSVTAQYAVIGVPIRLFAQLFIAMLLNHSLRGVAIFRSMIYLPSVVSGVALALVWILLFNGTFGLFNYLLWEILRIQGPNWLNSTQWVIPAFIIMSFWQMGPGIVIDLAGLQGIPRELYEAAEIDGANAVSKFITITLPMMSPLLLFNLIMGIVANFQVFTQAYVMTSGGPSNASLFYVLYLYRNAFEFFKMGYASAMAWLLFFVILLLTLLVFKSSPLWVFYQEKR